MKLLRVTLLICLTCLANTLYADNPEQWFDAVLAQHVDATGEVDYPGIQSDQRFAEYLDYLASADPKSFTSHEQQLAFWINAYNALAIKGILDGQSPSGFFSRITYFKTMKHALAGRDITLYELEHEIILPFAEPRIHFAIVCASASCPKLLAEAYSANRLEQQLQANTRAFINNPAKNRFDPRAKTAKISKIFDWYADDFVSAAGSIQQYLARYIDDAEAAALLTADGLQLRYLDYDWSLNGKPPAKPLE